MLESFYTIGINADDGLLISCADTDPVISYHAEQYEPIYIPGGHITHYLLRISGYIKHHKISRIPDGFLYSSDKLGYKGVHYQVLIFIGSCLQRNTYYLRLILCKIPCIYIRNIVNLIKELPYYRPLLLGYLPVLAVDNVGNSGCGHIQLCRYLFYCDHLKKPLYKRRKILYFVCMLSLMRIRCQGQGSSCLQISE